TAQVPSTKRIDGVQRNDDECPPWRGLRQCVADDGVLLPDQLLIAQVAVHLFTQIFRPRGLAGIRTVRFTGARTAHAGDAAHDTVEDLPAIAVECIAGV